MLHNVKAPDLPASNAAAVSQMRRVGKDLKNSWSNLVRVLDTGVAPAFSALVGPGKGFFNDFDSLEVGSRDTAASGDPSPRLTPTEERAHFSLWAALKAPLLLGNDPRNMSDATFATLSNAEVIAVNQDAAVTPVGLLARTVAPAASTAGANGIKTVMRVCAAEDASQRWTVDDDRIRSAAAGGTCLTIWHCLSRWPWWVTAAPCGDRDHDREGNTAAAADGAKCSTSDEQRFAFNATSGSITWIPTAYKPLCWGTPGSGCCLAVEGANPEVDTCGWAEDPTRQQWLLERSSSSGSGSGGGGVTTGRLRSAFADSGESADLCLSLAQDLEVYAGPLWGGRTATAVLFNRSPAANNVTLTFSDLCTAGFLPPAAAYEVRDLWEHKDLGTFSGTFTALVESHGVVHVNVVAPTTT